MGKASSIVFLEKEKSKGRDKTKRKKLLHEGFIKSPLSQTSTTSTSSVLEDIVPSYLIEKIE